MKKKKKKADRREEGEFNLRIRYRLMPGNDAMIEQHKKGKWNYTLWLRPGMSPYDKAVAIFHEWCHFMGYEYIPFNDEKLEHKWIDAMEFSFKAHWKSFWRGT